MLGARARILFINRFPRLRRTVRKWGGGFRTQALVRLATAVLDSYPVFFDRRRAELSRAEPQRIMRERRRQTAGGSRSNRQLAVELDGRGGHGQGHAQRDDHLVSSPTGASYTDPVRPGDPPGSVRDRSEHMIGERSPAWRNGHHRSEIRKKNPIHPAPRCHSSRHSPGTV